jgi:hypothetical protein
MERFSYRSCLVFIFCELTTSELLPKIVFCILMTFKLSRELKYPDDITVILISKADKNYNGTHNFGEVNKCIIVVFSILK